MPVFKLESFPNVCRLCLSAVEGKLVSLRTRDSVFDGGTIGDFITKISFKVDQLKSHLFPQAVCVPCFDLLKFFARFRSKVTTTHLLMNALVELRFSNCRPLVDLFDSNQTALEVLLTDIGVCDEVEDATAQTLMEEFPTYAIATVERADEIDLEEPVWDDVVTEERPTVRRVKRKAVVPETEKTVIVKRVVKRVRPKPVDETVELVADQPNEDQPANEEDSRNLKEIKVQYTLRCTKCKFTTEYLRELEAHQLKEHDLQTREFRCDKPGCPEVFQDAYLWYKHVAKMHKSYICDVCGTGQNSKHELRDHLERHKNNLNFECSYCGRRFNLKQDLGTHIRRIHRAEKNFECSICKLKFTTNFLLKTHTQTHNTELAYECPQCGKKFKSSQSLKSHLAEIHSNVRYPCDHCDKTYPKQGKLLDHVEAVHRIQCRFPCDVCVKPHSNAEDLAAHRLRHDNPKELECGLCLVAFLSAEEMAEHLCITYRDDYICCERDFRYHYAYNKHMFIKHGLKTNARVRPTGELLGVIKLKRKRLEMCYNCEIVFPTRTEKKKHQAICKGPPPPEAAKTSNQPAQDASSIPEFTY